MWVYIGQILYQNLLFQNSPLIAILDSHTLYPHRYTIHYLLRRVPPLLGCVIQPKTTRPFQDTIPRAWTSARLFDSAPGLIRHCKKLGFGPADPVEPRSAGRRTA